MFFKQRTNDDASISYFFGCGGQGKGIALDVLAGDEAWYMDQARMLGVEISMPTTCPAAERLPNLAARLTRYTKAISARPPSRSPR